MGWELKERTELQLNVWATGVYMTRAALSVEDFSQGEKDIRGEKDQAVRMLRDQVEEKKPAGEVGGAGCSVTGWSRIR